MNSSRTLGISGARTRFSVCAACAVSTIEIGDNAISDTASNALAIAMIALFIR